MHGNEGTFWNRQNVYNVLQVDDLDFIDSFEPDSELINNWISDESLYRQAVEKLKSVDGPFFLALWLLHLIQVSIYQDWKTNTIKYP